MDTDIAMVDDMTHSKSEMKIMMGDQVPAPFQLSHRSTCGTQQVPVSGLSVNHDVQQMPLSHLSHSGDAQQMPVSDLSHSSNVQQMPISHLSHSGDAQQMPVSGLSHSSDAQEIPLSDLSQSSDTQQIPVSNISHSGDAQQMPTSNLSRSIDVQRMSVSNLSLDPSYSVSMKNVYKPTVSEPLPEKTTKSTVAIRLNIPENSQNNANDMEKLQKAGLIVTTSGLQWKKPIQPEQKDNTKLEEDDDKLIEEIAGTLVAANEMIQASAIKEKIEPVQNEVPIENNLDVAINTMVVSNDDTGELKMTFTDSAVGRFETIDEKNGVSKETATDGTEEEKYLGVNLCGFSPLDDSNKKSRSRKTTKPARFAENENGYAPEITMSPLKKRKVDFDEPKVDTAKKGKKKGKGGNKKNKLNVDDVYDSGESDGDDLSRDVLKVRMCKCDICGKHFLDKDKLEQHKVSKHGQKKTKRPRNVDLNKEYPCEVCGYVFRRREHWRRHKIVHSKVTPFKCELCGRGFKRPEHVRRHQSVHTGDKPFKCDMCEKKFTRNEHLQKHIQVHLGKNPYTNKRKKSKKASLKIAKVESLAGTEYSSDTSSVTESPRKLVRPRLTVIDY